MSIIYIILCAVFLIVFFISKSYKSESIKKIPSKENPLKKLYPVSMYIEDKLLWRIPFLKSEKVEKNLKAVYVKEKVQEEKYLYKIKKISLCILIIVAFNLIGAGISISVWVGQNDYLYKISRPLYGEGSKEYELEVKSSEKDEEEKVNIVINEKKYSEEEIYKLFDDSYEKVIKKVLGENLSQDEVMLSINLINTFDVFNVSWKIENTELIDFSGNIYNKDIVKEGVITYLTAIFELDDIKKEYEIALRVLPLVEENVKSLEEKVQESLESANSEYDDQVALPSKIEDEKVFFKFPKDKAGVVYLFIGLIFAGVIFFGLDKELEKKVKRREEQMMMDYSDIVSKLTLLMGAGLTISASWDRIVRDYERKFKQNKKRFAFEEMKLANTKIKSGVSETVAYREFGKRCNLQSYIKLAGLLEQNVIKGTKELRILLESEVGEAFNNRKNLAKVKGEEASTKLLFPMIIMLGIVIVIIVVPAFLSMNL